MRKLLRLARHAAGLTQVELGKKAGIDGSKLSLYESGQVDLSKTELGRLRKVIDRLPQKSVLLASLMESSNPKLRRLQAGLSQRELCRAASIPRNRMSAFENGSESLTPEEKSRWETALRSDGEGAAIVKGFEDPKFASEAFRETFREGKEIEKKLKGSEEVVASLRNQIASLKKLVEIDARIIRNCKEFIEELEKKDQVSQAEITALREWLDSEQVAALAHGDAAAKREAAELVVAKRGE